MATLNVKGFPDSLYERLREEAERQHRSIAQQVTHLLERALEAAPAVDLLAMEGVGADVRSGLDASEHVERERASWR